MCITFEQAVREALSEDETGTEARLDAAEREALRTTCCWTRILDLQSDFVNEVPELQRLLREAGYEALFLPEFHCELNPIELYWGYIKNSELLLLYILHCFAG